MRPVKTLSVELVLAIHATIIRETGGAAGVRSTEQIEGALARPFAGFGGTLLYPSIEEQTAALTHGLIKGHPFVDGNKRTSFVTGATFLQLNGHYLIATQHDFEETAVAVADGWLSQAGLAAWFRRNSIAAD